MSRKSLWSIPSSQIGIAFRILAEKSNQNYSMKNKKKVRIVVRSSFLFVVLFALGNFSFGQEIDKLAKLRLAQGCEETGEWERATALYQDLCTLEPNNYLYLDGLQRSYTQIKEYNKAIGVIRRWLIIQPQDVNKMATLGGLYYDSGHEASADSVWNALLALDPHNTQLYRVVANEMLEHRMYDQCIRTYLAGRSASKNDATFADELGNLYSALQQYPAATKEYIRLINTTPDQLSFVQMRLGTFTVKPEGIRAATETVKDALNKVQGNIAMHRLYAWLLSESRLYENALEEYRIIDHLSNANGNEIFNFAQRLYQEHACNTAAAAFREIMEHNKNNSLLSFARFGYARALEELTDTSSSESHPMYTTSLQVYESIAAEHGNPELAVQSLYRIGFIKFEKLFDLNGALQALNRMKHIPSTSNIPYDAVLMTGEIFTVQNHLAEARKEYEQLNRGSLVVYQDQAAFKLAELDYYEAKFDSALSMLKRFNTNLSIDLANDALELQYFIQENSSSAPQAMEEFAKADLLMRQRKYSESLVQFRDIVQHYSAALLVDDALMKIGELSLLLQRPLDAIIAFRFVADSIQLSILKDRAQFKIAEVYQTVLINKALAIESYEKMLSQSPNSLYLEEARKRIRMLRGDQVK
jgi:tetratricopeptide (TPR) repeat protein